MIFLLNYTKLFIWTLIYSQYKSDFLLKIIKKNIDDCGCIATKFIQWALPKIEVVYDINKKEKGNEWFYEFEEFYDKCKTHSIEVTEKIYEKDFNNSIYDDFTIDELIASGSIGQVYKVHDKNDQTFAIKVLHPNMNYQILFLDYIIKIIYFFPFIRNIINYYLPISLSDFISDFKLQTNLINEANNCLKFKNEYKSNDLIIIPEVHKISKNILVMSYEEGIKIDDSNSSDYIKHQTLLLLKLFIKNNQHLFQFMHGDLHKGNWKMKEDGKIVIYDFGFCWKIPNYLKESFQIIDKAFLDVDNPKKIKSSFAEACHLFVNKKVDIEPIEKEVDLLSKELECDDPIFLIKLVINCITKNNIILNSYVLQSIILHNQLHKNFQDYNVTLEVEEDKGEGYISYNYYRKRIHDIICFCETKKIFDGYKNLLIKEYQDNDIKIEGLFDTVNNYDNIKGLKELAIS